jgi:hypothetical protein
MSIIVRVVLIYCRHKCIDLNIDISSSRYRTAVLYRFAFLVLPLLNQQSHAGYTCAALKNTITAEQFPRSSECLATFRGIAYICVHSVPAWLNDFWPRQVVTSLVRYNVIVQSRVYLKRCKRCADIPSRDPAVFLLFRRLCVCNSFVSLEWSFDARFNFCFMTVRLLVVLTVRSWRWRQCISIKGL